MTVKEFEKRVGDDVGLSGMKAPDALMIAQCVCAALAEHMRDTDPSASGDIGILSQASEILDGISVDFKDFFSA